jgi:hypothetical protein
MMDILWMGHPAPVATALILFILFKKTMTNTVNNVASYSYCQTLSNTTVDGCEILHHQEDG